MGLLRIGGHFSAQGTKKPWRLHQNYLRDLVAMKFESIEDEAMALSRQAAQRGADRFPFAVSGRLSARIPARLRGKGSLAVASDGLRQRTGGLLHCVLILAPHTGSGVKRMREITDKESRKWLDSVQAPARLHEQLHGTRLASVADQGGDRYELFIQAQAPGADLLVHAVRGRRVESHQCLAWSKPAKAPLLAQQRLRRSGRAAHSIGRFYVTLAFGLRSIVPDSP